MHMCVCVFMYVIMTSYMETLCILLTLCGIHQLLVDSPHKWTMIQCCNYLFVINMKMLLKKQSNGQRHDIMMPLLLFTAFVYFLWHSEFCTQSHVYSVCRTRPCLHPDFGWVCWIYLKLVSSLIRNINSLEDFSVEKWQNANTYWWLIARLQ